MPGEWAPRRRDRLLVNRSGDERRALFLRDPLERRIDRGEGDATVLRIDDAVSNRPPPAHVDELDARRRLRQRAAAEDDRGNVDVAQRLEDDLRADAGRIAEGDCQRLHADDSSGEPMTSKPTWRAAAASVRSCVANTGVSSVR